MRLFKRKRYPWEEDEEENGIENPANWSVRQELEKQFQNPMHDKPQTPNPFANIDTSNMSLRQELEAKFDALNDSSKTYPTQITPNLFQKNVIKDEQNDFEDEDGDFLQNVDYDLYGKGFDKNFIDEMLQNKTYQRALNEYAIPNEGGYVNLANDPGKETNMGISKATYKNEDIKNLTRERANAILYKDFWNWNGINKLPPEVAGFVFDHGIRTNPQNAVKTTHRVLGIPENASIIGPETLKKLNNMDLEEFLRRYKELVRQQDQRRNGYKHFGRGWDNRTNRYHLSR